MNYKLYGWLSTDPPILLHSVDQEDLGIYLPEEPITRLMTYMWHTTTDEIVAFHKQATELRPNHSLHHLINDPTICREVVARGISAHFVNHNAFLDEQRFVIRSSYKKLFDAVYNARMAPFKRHLLAAKIPKVLLIGGIIAGDDSPEYFKEQIDALPNGTFVHAGDNRLRSSEEVAELLSQAHVGLCLSACEGGMFAATEYLLCGLPVVSTVSLGGRDAWFDTRFTRVVPDDPDAVAAAVAELIELCIPSEFVRTETLCRMWEQRRRFLNLGQIIYSTNHVGRDFARDFYTNFTNKMGDWRKSCDVVQLFEKSQRR